MNKALLHHSVQDFIKNPPYPIEKIAFKGSPFKNVTTQQLLEQIVSRNSIKSKLPSWYKTENIIYPPSLNLEQTSSEATATYKASLVRGKRIADITGGFGVDCSFFVEKFEDVLHFEKNTSLAAIAAHNYQQLQKNVTVHNENGLKGIANKKFDVIYADPSRRNNTKGKVFFLRDCEPNIPEHIDFLLTRAPILLVKTSPMLDISAGLSELKKVEEVHIVAVNNEVKELLWLINANTKVENPQIICASIKKKATETFKFGFNTMYTCHYEAPKRYLYEPNSSILKSGGFKAVSEKFSVAKLAEHSHLYTSEHLIKFPGRTFSIEAVVNYSKKELKKVLSVDKANITTRNFPMSVAQLRKKWKIKEGGDTYLFFTTLHNDTKVVLICKKPQPFN